MLIYKEPAIIIIACHRNPKTAASKDRGIH